ncbi:MAG: elongation factor Ts [Crocinitomicaceae bacterium]|nr:elongation factor Ts [Crocinitomicaceae bacterium]|tara:strand:+ start:11284 stop:12102 length:819 start_codon:yes stop_codon:yes gene_type:complete
MAITAAEVNKLRKQTGLGLMDCKKALVETDGDFDKAIDLLRKKGQKIAAKRGENEASEGYVIAKTSTDGKSGINIVLNCETDFVAKNQEFVDFVNSIADLALAEKPASKEELASLNLNGDTVANAVEAQMGKIGEKLEISDFGCINAECVVAYNHPGNRTASLIGLNKSNAELGRDLAMQIAAMSPVAVDEADVPEELKQKELEIGKELAINEGKPAEMAEKIAFGRLKKYFKERTLLNQEFIKESKKSVRQYIEGVDKDLSVSEFKLITLA